MSAAGALAAWTGQALAIVEQIAAGDDDPVRTAIRVTPLTLSPAVAESPVVVVPILAAAALALAEQTGQAPEEIVGGWRRLAASIIDGYEDVIDRA